MSLCARIAAAAAVVFGEWQFELDLSEIEPCAAAKADSEACDSRESARAALVLTMAVPAKRHHLLVAVGSGYRDAVADLACETEGYDVLLLDGTAPTCRSLPSVVYRTCGSAYLSGVAAMARLRFDEEDHKEQEHRPFVAGILGGADFPTVRELVEGVHFGILRVEWRGEARAVHRRGRERVRRLREGLRHSVADARGRREGRVRARGQVVFGAIDAVWK